MERLAARLKAEMGCSDADARAMATAMMEAAVAPLGAILHSAVEHTSKTDALVDAEVPLVTSASIKKVLKPWVAPWAKRGRGRRYAWVLFVAPDGNCAATSSAGAMELQVRGKGLIYMSTLQFARGAGRAVRG